MILRSGFRFLALALGTAGLLALPQTAGAQGYSDSFEGSTLSTWWASATSNGVVDLSTAQRHTGSQSLEAAFTQGGTGPDYGEISHTFGTAVQGEFSVWVYDDPNAPVPDSLLQDLLLSGGAGNFVSLMRLAGGWDAPKGYELSVEPEDQSMVFCSLGGLAASAEWRRLSLTVSTGQVVARIDNAAGEVAECTLPVSFSIDTVYLQSQAGFYNMGGASQTATYLDDFCYAPPGAVCPCTAAYTVSLLYDPTKAVKAGSTIPIKLQLLQGGADVSSSSLVVHAFGLVETSTSISGDVTDAGNANPDSDFRYDATLGGYIFNLKTTGLVTGTYNLMFTVNGLGDPNYYASFQVR